jgi:signal transduction histidine kinase
MMKQKTVISSLLPILGVSISLSVGAILLGWLLFLLTNTISYFLFALLAVMVSTWYSGKKAGYLTLILTTLAIKFIFIAPVNSIYIGKLSSLVDLLIFIFAGTVINIIFDKIKNTKDIQMYKQKEKEYLALILHLQKENVHQQKEIKSRDEFLSIASHELKTPLSAMLLQIQTALYNIRSVSLANFSVEKLLKMLQSTEQQSKRLSKMINDLLNVSLVRTGRLDLEKESADLGQLVKDVSERFSEKAEREGSPIRLRAQEKVVGNFDKLRIEQAVTNLISNAIKYGDHEPIDIKVEKHGNSAKIIVSDQGIGIPKDLQERIFERFERAVSNHNYKGLGVGLYITQHIINTHNGRITLQSRPNAGSTFTIELPLTDAAPKQVAASTPTHQTLSA